MGDSQVVQLPSGPILARLDDGIVHARGIPSTLR